MYIHTIRIKYREMGYIFVEVREVRSKSHEG